MKKISRRTFNRIAGAAGVGAVAGLAAPAVLARAKAKVVVVGGGFGGATAAKYLPRFDPGIEVTLVEPSAHFVTCPFSNTVIGGLRELDDITQNFTAMQRRGVKVVHDMAKVVDGAGKKVVLAGGGELPFDRCVVSPGIDFKWGGVEGATPDIAEKLPHAWKAGPQTMLLRRQLEAMPDGGVFIVAPPVNPFRCPPGPGERISLVANYFKQHKPKSKIVVLDPKQKFSKQGLFTQGWDKLYPGMIDYHNVDNDGVVRRIDAGSMTLFTDFGEYKGDVINFIPAQRAGEIARVSGLTDATGWCPVDHGTFESKLVPGVHVIGDASIAAPMPKSGFAASTQGKVCAAAIAALVSGDQPGTPKFVNTCYSFVAPDYGISVAMVYGYEDGKIVKVKGSGGLSPSDASDFDRQQEALFADGWYRSISKDIWG
jgi:sulfide dehydrogenase [flavocytochrome c] flavoprotein subunit